MFSKTSLEKLARRGLILAMVFAIGGLPALADDDKRVKPRYDRGEAKRPSGRDAVVTLALPDDLVIAAPRVFGGVEGSKSASAGRAVRTRPGHGRAHDDHRAPVDVVALASDAASWTAKELAQTIGRRQYYRVGLYRGMRAALRDDSLGTWDYIEGRRFGRRDPVAIDIGNDLGSRAAEATALERAEAQVERQFRDLTREPVFAPLFDPPPYTVEGTWVVEPSLREVFRDFPPSSVPGLGPRVDRALAGWHWDPWRLYGCNSHTSFYDSGWRNPASAFDFWASDSRRARVLRRLDHDDRVLFEAVFVEEFPVALARQFDRHLARGYDNGFDDGWRYGSFISFEWHYRLGYSEGFDRGVAAAAERAFDAAYTRRYREIYGMAFDEWATTPKPDVLEVRLLDANDDGIFQPGEELLVEFDLANYGGADGSFPVRVDGYVLEEANPAMVRLPARSVVESSRPLRTTISPVVAPRTSAVIDFRFVDQRRRLNLYVSHPLEFRGDVSLARNTLAGTAVIEVRVVNRSRKPVSATISLDDVPGYDHRLAKTPRTLAPGAWSSQAFELDGLRPLDIIGGRIRAYFTVRSGEQIQDDLVFRVPDIASDLRSRDLLIFMVELSRDPTASPADIDAARALLLRRLRVDWKEAARGFGNPYKADLRHGGAETALGDLVRTYLEVRGEIARPEVFVGLDAEIVELARELPGVHPFLRKSMKRLARRLA